MVQAGASQAEVEIEP
jgi:hypothetical protein